MRIIPPLIYAGVFGVGVLLQRSFPTAALPTVMGRLLGAVCILPAAILSTWGLACFRRARTSPLPIRPTTALVTTGPYRIIRNPMYVGLALLHAGLALWFGIVWALFLLPIAIAIIRYHVIAGEERYLERIFGTEYLDYKARVPRWLPRLRR